MTLKFRATHALLIASAAAAALTGCTDKMGQQQQKAAAAPQAVQVVVEQVELSDAVIRTEAPGRATAYQVA